MINKMIPGEEEHLKYRLPLQGNTDTNADPISPGRCLKPHSNSPAMETTKTRPATNTRTPIRYINLLRTITGPIPGCGPAVAMFGRWSILVPFAFADGWILILSLAGDAKTQCSCLSVDERASDLAELSVRRPPAHNLHTQQPQCKMQNK